ncbi:MAG: abortive infection protein [Chloroflexi bacterium OLB14]|nr:MAG: abortive infection protein [Chloroflexi bacterium OLB14]
MKYLTGEKLNFDWKITVATIVSTLLLMIDHYHKLTAYKYLDRIILYLIIPLLIIIILYRENPKEYGFSFGDWKLGLTYTLLGILLMAPAIYFLGSGDDSMKKYYERFLDGLPWTTFLDLFGWEFFISWLAFYLCMRVNSGMMPYGYKPFRLQLLTSLNLKLKPYLPFLAGSHLVGWHGERNRLCIHF